MKLELELALRFLRRRRGLLRGTALAALAGVALATAALVVTLALMTGYRQAIATALQRGNAQIVGFSPQPMSPAEAVTLAKRLRRIRGVRAVGPVSYLSGLLEDPREPSNPVVVVVKAVGEPPAYTHLTGWPKVDGELPAVLGYRLARKVGAGPGGRIRLLLPPKGGGWVLQTLTFRVAGDFHLDFSEFDERWIVAPLDGVLRILPETGVAALEVELDDPMAVGRVRPEVERAAPSLMVTDWLGMNPALFAALRWQTISLFVVLALVAAVASFQVSSALVIVGAEKRRTSGMLQALGATPRRVRHILLLVGCMLGGAGVGTGMGVGWLVSVVMTRLRVIHFPPGLAKVYMVETIPLEVTAGQMMIILSVCLAVVFLASLGPARRAAALDPVAALRSV